jgi:hypothetical protein
MGKAYKQKRLRSGTVVVPYTSRPKWF